MRRQLDKLEIKTQEYENLLKEIGNIVDGRTAERIRNTLDKVGFPLGRYDYFTSGSLIRRAAD